MSDQTTWWTPALSVEMSIAVAEIIIALIAFGALIFSVLRFLVVDGIDITDR